MNNHTANEDAESRQDRLRRIKRERYAFVRSHHSKLYGDICAFAGTIDLSADDLAARAKIEEFCMDVAKRALESQ